MVIQKRALIVLVLLIAFSAYLTAYTVMAHSISSNYVFEEAGKVYWSSSPNGSLFPWPKGPGMMQVISEMTNETDLFIYNYLIKTGLLAAFSVALWLLTALFIYWMLIGSTSLQ